MHWYRECTQYIVNDFKDLELKWKTEGKVKIHSLTVIALPLQSEWITYSILKDTCKCMHICHTYLLHEKNTLGLDSSFHKHETNIYYISSYNQFHGDFCCLMCIYTINAYVDIYLSIFIFKFYILFYCLLFFICCYYVCMSTSVCCIIMCNDKFEI